MKEKGLIINVQSGTNTVVSLSTSKTIVINNEGLKTTCYEAVLSMEDADGESEMFATFDEQQLSRLINKLRRVKRTLSEKNNH